MHHEEITRMARKVRTSLKGIWRPAFRIIIGLAISTAAMTTNSSAQDIKILKTKLKGGVVKTNPAVPATVTSDNILPEGFSLRKIAEGTDPLENPSGVITTFGELNNASTTATEPDQNTYLVLDDNPGGPTPGFDYGRHFLFQGHENAGNLAYVTRINLDVASPDHRITLLTPVDATGLTNFNSIDGSAWDPFTGTMLFAQEAGANGGVIEMSSDFDPNTGGGAGLRTLYG